MQMQGQNNNMGGPGPILVRDPLSVTQSNGQVAWAAMVEGPLCGKLKTMAILSSLIRPELKGQILMNFYEIFFVERGAGWTYGSKTLWSSYPGSLIWW